MMGMKMVMGREFAEETGDSLHYCILNETAARVLGFSEPVGERIYTDGEYHIVRGVVKDAQTKSLHQGVDPQIYFEFSKGGVGTPTVLFKVQGNPGEAVRVIQSKWNELNPGTPFEYHFLDDTYARLYKAETNAGQILAAAMGITLLISIAGLFAMAYYTTQRRLKEIGVRKVNGASVPELLVILNRSFFVWIGISFVLACPLAYIFISRWLESFTDRTEMSWWVFIAVGIITFIVTLLTVSYQTWKAANVNPVRVLKME
jgi:putative ABC transport system permease protein